MSEFRRRLQRLEETVRNLIQPNSRAKFVASRSGERKYFMLLEDAGGEYGPVYAQTTDRSGVVEGPVIRLYWWDFLLSGVSVGYKSTMQRVDGDWTFEPGICPVYCISDGSINAATPPAGTVGTAYTHSVSGTNIDSGSLAATKLPDGLGMDAAGTITGIPTAAGVYHARITGTSDKTGPGTVNPGDKCTLTKVAKITISPAVEEDDA